MRSFIRRSFLGIFCFTFFLIPLVQVDAAQEKNYLGAGMIGLIRNDANAIFFPPSGWKENKSTKDIFVEFALKSKKGIPTFITVDEVSGVYISGNYTEIKTWSDLTRLYIPSLEKDTEYTHVINKSFMIDGVQGIRVDTPGTDAHMINIYFEKFGKVYVFHAQVSADKWKVKKTQLGIEQSIQVLSVRRLGIERQ
ncbi:hypothetical protein K2X96_03350 [Patescibacteria group bacterium]|nr:hypothetical protein [Patescibacteria group bacterium]